LDARLTTLLYKKITVAKYKEVNTGWSSSRQIWQNILRKAMLKKGCFFNDDEYSSINTA
jgi:hypothetical protein